MIYITRRETFNAAHRLFKPEWNDEQNLKVFRKMFQSQLARAQLCALCYPQRGGGS
jgi:hypothetical protein